MKYNNQILYELSTKYRRITNTICDRKTVESKFFEGLDLTIYVKTVCEINDIMYLIQPYVEAGIQENE